jgi:hypothetical protein
MIFNKTRGLVVLDHVLSAVANGSIDTATQL